MTNLSKSGFLTRFQKRQQEISAVDQQKAATPALSVDASSHAEKIVSMQEDGWAARSLLLNSQTDIQSDIRFAQKKRLQNGRNTVDPHVEESFQDRQEHTAPLLAVHSEYANEDEENLVAEYGEKKSKDKKEKKEKSTKLSGCPDVCGPPTEAKVSPARVNMELGPARALRTQKRKRWDPTDSDLLSASIKGSSDECTTIGTSQVSERLAQDVVAKQRRDNLRAKMKEFMNDEILIEDQVEPEKKALVSFGSVHTKEVEIDHYNDHTTAAKKKIQEDAQVPSLVAVGHVDLGWTTKVRNTADELPCVTQLNEKSNSNTQGPQPPQQQVPQKKKKGPSALAMAMKIAKSSCVPEQNRVETDTTLSTHAQNFF